MASLQNPKGPNARKERWSGLPFERTVKLSGSGPDHPTRNDPASGESNMGPLGLPVAWKPTKELGRLQTLPSCYDCSSEVPYFNRHGHLFACSTSLQINMDLQMVGVWAPCKTVGKYLLDFSEEPSVPSAPRVVLGFASIQ